MSTEVVVDSVAIEVERVGEETEEEEITIEAEVEDPTTLTMKASLPKLGRNHRDHEVNAEEDTAVIGVENRVKEISQAEEETVLEVSAEAEVKVEVEIVVVEVVKHRTKLLTSRNGISSKRIKPQTTLSNEVG